MPKPAPERVTRDELLARIRAARQELLDAIDAFPPEQRELPCVLGEWSLKDTLVHLNYWGGQLVTLLYQLRSGAPLTTLTIDPLLDVDALNRRWHLQGKDRPWDLAWADFSGVHTQTLRRVAEFSDEELNNPHLNPKLRRQPLWRWIAADTCEHEAEHARTIRAYLEQS